MVAEFVIESETAENIAESLTMLKQWNPTWKLQYFMTDYSEAEVAAALEIVFPNTTIYLCNFHSWDHWVKDRKHGLTQAEAEELLALLRDCAWAQPSSDDNLASGYELAVQILKVICMEQSCAGTTMANTNVVVYTAGEYCIPQVSTVFRY